MLVKNSHLTNELTLVDVPFPIVTTATSNSPIPPVHGAGSVARNSSTKPQPTEITLAVSGSNTNTASTYAAALAAVISSRTNTERIEGLVRGPLGMPMHVLAASSSTYALPASAPSVSLVKTSSSSPPLPEPSTAPSKQPTTLYEIITSQQTIPGQVVQDMPTVNNATTSSPIPKSSGSEPKCSSTSLKFPPASILTSANTPTLSTGGLIGSTSFTSPNTLPNSGNKYEPELLLSPAKLGQ